MDDEFQNTKEPLSSKIIHFIQGVWPSVYGTLNDILFGIIRFVKDTISGLWG